MIDEIKEHKALVVKSHQYLCVQFCGLNCVNTIFLVKLELLDKINTMTRCSRVILNIFHTFNEMIYGHSFHVDNTRDVTGNPTFRKKVAQNSLPN